LITIKDNVKFTRNNISEFLEENNIQTRNLFAGNILKHPLFAEMKEGVDFRVADELQNTDKIMNDSFWIGVYPGMSDEMIAFMINKIKEFIE
jgi:CDP-6-deoxy-D-xylo-4-hexulose-3-dehydrase